MRGQIGKVCDDYKLRDMINGATTHDVVDILEVDQG